MEREAERPNGAEAREFRGRGSRRVLGVGVGVALLVVVGVLGFRVGGSGEGNRASSPTRSPSASASVKPSVADVFKRVGPSVVVIRADSSLGTGVVAADDGTILTAHHVVEGAKKVRVTFSDGTEVAARVASADPKRDIATLAPAGLPEILVPATLGGGLQVGAEVVAIGNPLGLTYSVSSGVVSGLDRRADSKGSPGMTGLIQFDASANPGSSGGPLLDARGLVVGIVVSIADPGHDEAFAGIAFAVPIGTALGGADGEGPPGNGPQI
ncbi:S1C family serine protease [Actinocorallia longicatena]|uniref:Trypsin-like peptidase n=1 Tax=Actinocorallia longicatena TaxID=111803 RepID=A0ABP6Q9E3_9ACTN